MADKDEITGNVATGPGAAHGEQRMGSDPMSLAEAQQAQRQAQSREGSRLITVPMKRDPNPAWQNNADWQSANPGVPRFLESPDWEKLDAEIPEGAMRIKTNYHDVAKVEVRGSAEQLNRLSQKSQEYFTQAWRRPEDW